MKGLVAPSFVIHLLNTGIDISNHLLFGAHWSLPPEQAFIVQVREGEGGLDFLK